MRGTFDKVPLKLPPKPFKLKGFMKGGVLFFGLKLCLTVSFSQMYRLADSCLPLRRIFIVCILYERGLLIKSPLKLPFKTFYTKRFYYGGVFFFVLKLCLTVSFSHRYRLADTCVPLRRNFIVRQFNLYFKFVLYGGNCYYPTVVILSASETRGALSEAIMSEGLTFAERQGSLRNGLCSLS